MLSFTLKQIRDPIRPRRYAISEKQHDARRTMKMASAIALIAACRSAWQDVSAASLELQYNRRGDALSHELVIRVSQNGVMSVTALQGLNDLLAKILCFAGGTKGRRWKSLQTRQGDTDETQRGIVHEFVQKRFIHDIISYCFDKLLQIISNRFKPFVACWETIKGHSSNIAKLYVHAEVKLAMFYIANPNRHPLHGIIGVSKKLCLSCDLFFKALQNPKFDNAGPPIDFVFAATHKLPYNSWKIPKLPENTQIHKDTNEKTLVERRVMLAILEVMDTFGEQTKQSLEAAFGLCDTYSESSGHSGDEVDKDKLTSGKTLGELKNETVRLMKEVKELRGRE